MQWLKWNWCIEYRWFGRELSCIYSYFNKKENPRGRGYQALPWTKPPGTYAGRELDAWVSWGDLGLRQLPPTALGHVSGVCSISVGRFLSPTFCYLSSPDSWSFDHSTYALTSNRRGFPSFIFFWCPSRLSEEGHTVNRSFWPQHSQEMLSEAYSFVYNSPA
jgi:hypothetical protein